MLASLASRARRDVTRKQLHKCLAGVSLPPVNTVASLANGVQRLVLLPIEQYQRDGRFGHGLRRGAFAFARTVTLEALGAGSKVAMGAQALLEAADDIVAPAVRRNVRAVDNRRSNRSNRSRRAGGGLQMEVVGNPLATQPRNAREGFAKAAVSISRGVREAADTIVAIPIKHVWLMCL